HVLEETGAVREEDELLRLERDGDVARDAVRVDVEDPALAVRRERADDRDVAAVHELVEQLRVHALDVADVAPVDLLLGAGDLGARPPLRDDEARVRAGEADAGDVLRLEGREELEVELARVDHLRDLERLVVGHAATRDDRGLVSELLRELGRLRPAAVHDREADAELVEEGAVLAEARE